MFDEQDRVRVRNVAVTVTLLAWIVLWTRSMGFTELSHAHAYHHAVNHGLVSPHAAVDWLLMLAAMMTPVLISPIQFVRGNGLARRRPRSTGLFAAGYAAVWMLAGVLILWAVAALSSSRFPAYCTAGAVFLIALVWQCSPAKQVCLNRCHMLRAMAAFGRAADTEALVFGAKQGAWCAGSCWAWMLLPLLLPAGHFGAMIAASILIFCERLDDPVRVSWRWRGLGRARRIAAAWL